MLICDIVEVPGTCWARQIEVARCSVRRRWREKAGVVVGELSLQFSNDLIGIPDALCKLGIELLPRVELGSVELGEGAEVQARVVEEATETRIVLIGKWIQGTGEQVLGAIVVELVFVRECTVAGIE